MDGERDPKMLSFVIPCYRSSQTIGHVVERIERVVEADGRYRYEIICVNDYSPDNTWDVLRVLADDDPHVKAIGLSRNFGQHSALMAGFNYVSGDIIVSLDDDGQNPPEEVFKLVDKLEEGYDLVSAKYLDKKHSWFRRLGSKLSMEMSTMLVGKPKDIDLNSYCVFRRFVADEIVKYQNAYPFVHGLMLRVTRNIANVPITHADREVGTSGYSFRKLVSLWMNGFTAFSEKPLRIASVLGFVLAFAGFIFGLVIIIRKLLNPAEVLAGYSSMMAVMLFLVGIVLLFQGLLGEYIGRIYICQNNAPQYVIKETVNIPQNPYNELQESVQSEREPIQRSAQ